MGERGLAEYAAGKLAQSVDSLRKWLGEEGVGGGGLGGLFSLLEGVQGREGSLVVSSPSEEGACSSQESMIGDLLFFGFLEGEIERLLREDARP